MSELKQHGGKIALANKILIPRIAARKFPTMDVIYSDGRKSKLPIFFMQVALMLASSMSLKDL
ncbi:hypothetical protein F383_05854 [Gossypium arboreum]|uniref:Uncharacterized protein n=1 Tax=Gossypium arboreum TaxID=29729 RepID=A0A0B0P8J6_GOSAR|nr:hypothetical protein F383_05854 [Gossypium arboreum]